MDLKNAKVYTLDGKNVGRVTEVDTEYFTTQKKGLLTDEEYRVPLDGISHIEPPKDDIVIIRLALNEEQLKHGFEFVKGKPNSEFVSGKDESELKVPTEKQVIHYEAMHSLEENIANGPSTEGLPQIVEYSCDMCAKKFDDADRLQEHRAEVHKGPTGI